MRAVVASLLSAFSCVVLLGPVQAAPAYTVRTLDQLAVYPQLRAVARVVPENESRLAAEVTARIRSIPARVGESVTQGQVLVRLDSAQYALALEQAQAQVELLQNRYRLAQLQFEQARSLHESNFISAQALEQRRTELAVLDSELKIARNGVEQARLDLRRTTIVAPFAGAIRERLAGEGELATPGQPILTVVEHAKNELRAQVPNQDLPSLQTARAPEFYQGGSRRPVTLVRVAPLVDARAQTREVVLRADRPLLAGAAGELVWSSATPHLPAAYVQQYAGKLGAWIEEGGEPVFKPLPQAEAGRPAAVTWPLATRIIDEGRFALGGPAAGGPAPAAAE